MEVTAITTAESKCQGGGQGHGGLDYHMSGFGI